MAQVHLLTATAPDHVRGHLELNYLRRSAARDVFGRHTLVDDPVRADLILFAEREGTLKQVLCHPYLKRFREKTFVVNPRYKGPPLVPGVFASVQRSQYHAGRTRSGHYLEVVESELFHKQPFPDRIPYLYSFAGAAWTAPVRERLIQLAHPRGYVVDTAPEGITLQKVKPTLGEAERAYISRYVELCRQSAFVLCPRGTGPSSLRLFESMLMGRAPVVISDAWVPPAGPDWDTFSLRVPEADVDAIPALLEQHESRARAMGQQARAAWEQWFSEEVSFHRTVEQCLELQRSRPLPETVLRLWSYARLMPAAYLRDLYHTRLQGRLQSARRRLTRAFNAASA